MRKIIGATITSIALLSAGTTFALSDHGAKLSIWYNHHFEEKAKKLGASTMDELSSSLTQLQKEMKSLRQSMATSIQDYQSTKLQDSTNSIQEHNEQYINQLHTVTEKLKEQNAEQMAAYTQQKTQQETVQITQDVQDILEDLLKNN